MPPTVCVSVCVCVCMCVCVCACVCDKLVYRLFTYNASVFTGVYIHVHVIKPQECACSKLPPGL